MALGRGTCARARGGAAVGAPSQARARALTLRTGEIFSRIIWRLGQRWRESCCGDQSERELCRERREGAGRGPGVNGFGPRGARWRVAKTETCRSLRHQSCSREGTEQVERKDGNLVRIKKHVLDVLSLQIGERTEISRIPSAQPPKGSLPHYRQPPPEGCIPYKWRSYSNAELSPEVHSLHQGSLLVASVL